MFDTIKPRQNTLHTIGSKIPIIKSSEILETFFVVYFLMLKNQKNRKQNIFYACGKILAQKCGKK